MADTNPTETRVTRNTVIDVLADANMRLSPRRKNRAILLTSPCSDLWDDQLELIDLLMEIDAGLGLGRELDWEKAPPSSASVNDFIEWIVKEMNHG